MLTNLDALHAAALYTGLITFLMMGLKMYVGFRRGTMKIPPGDVSNVEFGRVTRVQMNAVEDVPLLIVGLLALALLGANVMVIHGVGATLVVARVLHAAGLAMSGGFSFGRALGTLGTLIAYVAIGGALVYHALTAPGI